MELNNIKDKNNNKNTDLKSNFNNNYFLIGNIKLKYGDELFITLFKIFSFLNIFDVCNFVGSSKKLAILNFKDYQNYKIVVKIKKYILFSDIRGVNFFSFDYFSRNSSFDTKNLRNFKNRTIHYSNLSDSIINKRQIFIDNKKFSIGLLNNLLKKLNFKKFDNIHDFYNSCSKVRIFTPIKIAIFRNDFSKVKKLLETKSVIMKRPKNCNPLFNGYRFYFVSIRLLNDKMNGKIQNHYNFLSRFTKITNYEFEFENIFDCKLQNVFKQHYKELNIFSKSLNKLFDSVLREKSGVFLNERRMDDRLLNDYIHVNDCSLPIHQAAINGNVKIMKLILDYPNININEYNFYKQTPLYLSILHNNTDIALLLLNQKRINVNGYRKLDRSNKSNQFKFYRNSPLIIAIKNKNYQVIEKLVENPKLILDMIEDNSSPLILALKVQYLESSLRIISLILNSSLKINVNTPRKKSKSGKKILSLLEYSIRKYSKISEENKDYMKKILNLIIDKENSISKRNRMRVLLDENRIDELLAFCGNCNLHLKNKKHSRKSIKKIVTKSNEIVGFIKKSNNHIGSNEKIKRDNSYKKLDKETKENLDKICERRSTKNSWKNSKNKKDKDRTKLRKLRIKGKGKW